jgi:hypothetical protein
MGIHLQQSVKLIQLRTPEKGLAITRSDRVRGSNPRVGSAKALYPAECKLASESTERVIHHGTQITLPPRSGRAMHH